MTFPPEKNQGLLDAKNGKRRETEALPGPSFPPTDSRVYQPGPDSRSSAIRPSPTFPAEKPPTPPLIRLEYHPEPSSSSRAIVSPTFPASSDNDAPPPSYYSDGFANSSSSHSAPTPASSITNAAMSAPMVQPPPRGPPSFARPPSREVTYPNFQPMFLVATGNSLSNGFPYISPASDSNPHPFASHDVYETDWMSFLREAQMVAALSPKQIELSEHLPILSILPIVKHLASYGVQQLMKNQNAPKVIDCIDRWNRHFFEQRKMRIILMKGPVRVSGQNEYHDLNDTPTSSSSEIESVQKLHDDHPPPSNPSISKILKGVKDDVHRLFIVPLL